MSDESQVIKFGNPEIAATVRCSRRDCANMVDVARDSWDFVKVFNRILIARDECPFHNGEIALCEACKPLWKAAVDRQVDKEREKTNDLWNAYRASGGNTTLPRWFMDDPSLANLKQRWDDNKEIREAKRKKKVQEF